MIMTNEVLAWVLIFAVSALIFLGIAAVVTVRGFFDLRALLRDTKAEVEPAPERSEEI